MMQGKFLAAISMLWAALAVGDSKPILVDGTAARVGESLITIQDAHIYRSLKKFMEDGKNVLELEQGEALRKTVQKMIFSTLVYKELQAFNFEGVQKSQAIRLIETHRAKQGRQAWDKVLRQYQISEATAVELVWKDMLVELFVQKKVETLTPIITPAEIERYYEQNKGRFRGTEFESLKATIVLLLKKERVEKGLQEWIKYLKEKHGVTDLLSG